MKANKSIFVEKYPIPHPERLFSKLAGCKKFSKLDLSSAYSQLMLDDSSKEITTINTPRGLFQYNRLSFGLCSSPGIFQRTMDQILKDLPGVLCYLDDVLIGGGTKEELDNRVRQVLKRFSDNNFRLKIEKCEWSMDSISYLGYIIDANGIHPSSEKIAAISGAPAPKNVKELQSYLGLLNFYRKFLPNASTLLEPLNSLLRNDKEWVWGSEQASAFKKSKEILTSDSVLVHFDPKYPIVVTADSSSYGVGAVLSLKIGSDERPVCYVSRTLNSAEKNYCQTEREALALVFAVKRFHYYLYGHHFTLVTDHKPLLGLLSLDKPIALQASGRVIRWSLMLQSYKFTLIHKSGKFLGNADALSRLPLERGDSVVPIPSEWVHLVNFLNETPINAELIQGETKKCKLLSEVMKFLHTGWPNTLQPEFAPFKNRNDELTIQSGCLLWGNRIVIPSSLQRRVLEELHVSHPGITRMKQLARGYLWFPNIDAEIENFVKTCTACLENTPSPKKASLHPWEWPQNAWHRLHIDHAQLNDWYFLIIIDAYSKWVEVFPCKTITSKSTINFLRHTFARFGLPVHLVSDNGPSLVSQEFEEFMKMNGIRHITVSPYHPSSNGLAENFVKTFKQAMMKTKGGEMQEKVDKFLFRYRITPHSTTGKSPTELLLKRKVRTVFDLLSPDELTRNFVQKKQEAQKRNHDPKIPRNASFPNDTKVMVRNYARGPKWIPGKVVSK